MTDLYQSNRSQSESCFRALLQQLETGVDCASLPGPTSDNLQPLYLEFKRRVQEILDRETRSLQEEVVQSNNTHLFLLKRSALVDAVVKTAFDVALWLHNERQGSQLKEQDLPVAIVARGSYGREEVYFASEICLKIVFRAMDSPEKINPATDVVSLFEYLFVFQDLFPSSARTGCANLDTEGQVLDDSTLDSLFSLLEHRLVAGNETVYQEFASSLQTAALLHKEKFMDYGRRFRFLYDIRNTVFRQEPNVKTEIERVYWALCLARIHHGIAQKNLFEVLEALFDGNHISAPAFKSAQFALNFLGKTRMVLHCHQKGAQRDTLSYEVRESVAQDLGYTVPEFFNEYFFKSVLPLKRYSRNLYFESFTSETKKLKTLSPDFGLNDDNQIAFTRGQQDYTWNSSGDLLNLFVWASRKNCLFSYPVIRSIEENLDSLSPMFEAPDSAGVQSYFQSIIRGKFFAHALRYLHEFGLLDRFFIPEFKNLTGMLQDIYVHLFPTDIHILAALDALNRLDLDPEADPFLVDLYQSMRDKSVIRLAVLLHDIGKGLKAEGENEELVGARAIPGILENLGYGKNQKLISDIAFLVEKHLMMRDLMMLDPDEDDTYEMIWDLVDRNVERLKMLIILTYADRAATKMNMSASQIDQLKYFYQNTLHHKKRVGVSRPVRNEFLSMIRLPRDMQGQLEIYNDFKKSRDNFSTEIFFKADQASELVICTQDQRGLLFKVAAVIAFNHLTIVDARIHTLDQNVFDVFKIMESGEVPIDFSGFFTIQKKVKEDLRKVFVGQIPVSELYRGRQLTTSQSEDRPGEIKLKVSIIGRAVKLETDDILGTIMMETKVFSQLNMEIQRAVINTSYGTASNIFYLRPEDVREIMKDEDRFKETLKSALEPLHWNEPIFPDSPAEVA